MTAGGSTKMPKQRNRKGKLRLNFASFISFGVSSTICACCFLTFYLLLLAGLLPLLNFDNSVDSSINQIPAPAENHGLQNLPMLNEQEKQVIGSMAQNLKTKLQNLRNSRGMSDLHIKDAVMNEFQRLRHDKQKKKELQKSAGAAVVQDPVPAVPGRSPGFLVVGMHRSGTSMLSGLLVNGCGYEVGGPLIGAKFDNEKGFFERIDAVLQNDEFMKSQRIWWASGVRNYDSDKALADLKAKKIPFQEGEKALAFLNNPGNVPWLQKDPRMCITLKTWLPLLNGKPSVLFTYRHPMEVALSLQHREKFQLEQGLRLWVIYNMRGVQNSQGLCRVLSSNDAILADPLGEVQRIASDLTTKCGVPEAPRTITQEDVDKFIDPNMQHGKKQMGEGKAIIETMEDGCVIRDYDSDFMEDGPEKQHERDVYMTAMRIHCAFKSGKAYEDDYEWPQLP